LFEQLKDWLIDQLIGSSTDQNKLVTGQCAYPYFLKRLAWISFDHQAEVLLVIAWISLDHQAEVLLFGTARAFQFGSKIFVALDVVLWWT
jgi:hypothetical protein